MSQVHELKCWVEYFTPVVLGAKLFELRKDDRHFAIMDSLRLREWLPDSERYTGNELIAKITFLLRAEDLPFEFGLQPGYVILGIEVLDKHIVN